MEFDDSEINNWKIAELIEKKDYKDCSKEELIWLVEYYKEEAYDARLDAISS